MKTLFKAGQKVRLKADGRIYYIYNIYNENEVSLCLYGYKDAEQDYLTNIKDIESLKRGKIMTAEEKQSRLEARRTERKALQEQARIEAEKAQKPVKSLKINIEWRKSRMWGNNPFASVEISFHDGSYLRDDGFTCSGCGYDKESTVIAEIFNKYLKYKLWTLDLKKIWNGGRPSEKPANSLPYGIAHYSINNPHYSGGVGTSCYFNIAEAIGGHFERLASGKTFDAYQYTDTKKKGK